MMRLLTIVLALSLTACASAPVETHHYLLRPTQAMPGDTTGVIRLARVEIAPYLDQEGIALALQTGEIQAARHNRWSEPLSYSVRRYLQVAIAAETQTTVEVSPINLGAERAVVEVVVHQLHGYEDGQVRLVAEWMVRTSEAVPRVVHREFAVTRRIEEDGYPALVRQHGELLDALAADIAAGLGPLLLDGENDE